MEPTTILTPDQRLRVFVSSTMRELAPERAAARRAIEGLRLTPVLFELGARPYPPRSLYLAYLGQSHVFVGIYGEQYGWVAPDMAVSGVEDELRHAGDLPQLLYVKAPAAGRDPRLTAMLAGVAAAAGVSYKSFSSAEELERLLADDLALLLTERFTARSRGGAAIAVPRPASEFVGRRAELADVAALLCDESVRLVTLTGPGGIGKTRLAIESARAVADRFADGAVFVPLAARTAEDFLEAIAAAVGVKDLGEQPLPRLLAERLADRRELLVLDNCEQLVPAAGRLAELIEQTVGPRFLVTSRTALRLAGEEEFPVPPLTVPRVTGRLDEVSRAEAVQLFCRRVAAVRHGFRITADDAADVARICRRLDGLPLALELVAARAHVLSIAELAARLDSVLDLAARSPDVPERQRTLRRTMDWSYEQLDPSAGRMFAQLGAFVGAFSLEAAATVCEIPPGADVLDLLALLVDHSLLRAQPGARGTRFAMLQIVREYAGSLLGPADLEAVGARHAGYFRGIALAAAPALRGSRQRQTIAGLDADGDDIAAAVDWLLTRGRRTDVADICWSLWLYHWLRGALTEGRRWTRAALAADDPLPPTARARVLAADGILATWQRDYASASPELAEALEIAGRVGDDEVRMLVDIVFIIVCGGHGDEQRARVFAEQGLGLARTLKDRWAEAQALTALCWLDAALGRFQDREDTFTAMLATAREVEDPLTTAMALNNLAELRLWQGRSEEARSLLAESIGLFAQLGMANAGAACLHTIAFLLAGLGEWSTAVELQAAADAAQQRIEAGTWPPWATRREHLLTDAREHLTDLDYTAAYGTGEKWSFTEATTQAAAALSQAEAAEPAKTQG